MGSDWPGRLGLPTALLACVFLAGCGVSVSFGNGPTPRSSLSPKRSATPSAVPAATTPTVSLTLAVDQLPTEYAGGGAITYPPTIIVIVPATFASRLAAYGVAGTVVLGPAGWTGGGVVGADGSTGFTLKPTESGSGRQQMVFSYDGGCVGCAWSDASAYFPAVAQAIGAQSLPPESPPSGLSSDVLGPGLIAYSLPDPLFGVQANGVALTTLPGQDNDTVAAVFENLSLTLSANEHSLATVILNAFLDSEDRYVCSAVGSPTLPLLLQGSALGSIGPACG